MNIPIHAAQAQAEALSRLEFEGLRDAGGAAALLLAAAALGLAAFVAFYRREQPPARAWLRWPCLAFRLLVWTGLVVIFLDPVIVTDVERETTGVCVVLVDESLSMSAKDAEMAAGPAAAWARALGVAPEALKAMPRGAVVDRLLYGSGRGAALLTALRARNRVLVGGFAGKMTLRGVYEKLPPGAGPARPEQRPAVRADGASTDLSAALEGALRASADAPLAAVVLLSDGQDNAGADPEQRAAEIRARGARLYTVGIGDPAPARNLILQSVHAPEYALKGNPIEFRAVLSQSGLEGSEATVRLTALPEAGAARPARTVEEKRVTLRSRLTEITFTDRPASVGVRTYEVVADALPGEAGLDDNRRRKAVTILDDKVKVLLVAGTPGVEYRFLKALLERTPGFDTAVWLQDQDPRVPQGGRAPMARFPAAADALADFDLIVLLDPRRDDVTADWIGLVGRQVSERGAGLVWVAGPRHTASMLSDPAFSAVLGLLPVRVEPDRLRSAAGGALDTPWQPELTAVGESSPITRLADSAAANLALWREMPGQYWSLPVSGEKPGAFVLLRSSNPRLRAAGQPGAPLLAWQFYGAGRVVFAATDESWQWRRLGIEVYDRLWLQLARFAVQGRATGGRRRIEFVTTQREFAFGEAVPLGVRLYDRSFNPLSDAACSVTIRREGSVADTVELRAAGAGGLCEYVYYPPAPGFYEVECRGPDDQRASSSFTVGPPPGELDRLSLDEQALRRLAERSGGEYLGPERIGALPEMIQPRFVRRVESLPPRPVWNRATVLAALLGLLALEWTLRRLAGLI